MKLNEDSNERKEGVEEYEENLPEKCDYCNSEIWELYPQKLIRCEDPNFEEVKTNSIATFNYICEDCCTERILQGDCEGLTCNHFKDKYPDIRISKVEEKLNKYNIPYEIIDGNILSKVSRFPQWGYFFSKLPSDLSSIQELIEDNFIITLNSGHKTKLQISGEEQNWFVEIELIDFFKEDFWFETSNYYISTKEIEEDGEKIKIKYLIIKYSNSHGNLPPEYLIVQMHSNYGSNYSNSEFIYDPHQIKIKKKKIDRIKKDLKLFPIKLYFAQVNLRKNFYTKEGIIKNDFRDQIVKEINENLKNAKSNNSNMILFPEYCFPIDILPNLRKFSKTEKIWIIGGIERCVSKRYNLDLNKNAVFILSPNKAPIIQLKHFSGRDNPPFHPGKELYLIDSRFGVFCVLICADFLEDSLLLKLREQVDFIIIICFNKDINEFRTRAYNKCLANNCYIIITNILKYKGYCIHAPFPKSEREYFLSSFPYCELDFTEFTLHRRKIEISKKYKKPLSDTLYNYGFHYFKK